MIEALRQRLLVLLRIPAAPHLPPGEEATSTVFRADAAYYRLRLWAWILRQGVAALGLVVGLLVLHALLSHPAPPRAAALVRQAPSLFVALETFAVLSFLVQLPFSFLALRWDYECRFYVLTERCVRIQEGIWNFREQTFTLANIQNLDVRQGPLQRLFGISDLVLRTAGGGEASREQPGQPPSLHEGSLKGLGDAAGVRNHILAQMKRYRDGGLGDPGDAQPQGATPDLATAAREAAAAARSLAKRLSP
jgi:membrane protein YdbS with pleckstrin-like domain